MCREGFNAAKGAFVQYYGADELDASLLLLPLVGFLPADDPRMRGTIEAIGRELMTDGLVQRYRTQQGVDGLPPGEGVFLACSFWYADCLTLLGRRREARALFEKLLGLCNDVGLLAEEYDPAARRSARQFPAGVLAPGADQYGAEPGECARPGASARRQRAGYPRSGWGGRVARFHPDRNRHDRVAVRMMACSSQHCLAAVSFRYT